MHVGGTRSCRFVSGRNRPGPAAADNHDGHPAVAQGLDSVGAAAWQQREAPRPRARCSSNQQGIENGPFRVSEGSNLFPQRRNGIKNVPSRPIWERICSLKRHLGAVVAQSAAWAETPKPHYVNNLVPTGRLSDPSDALFSASNVPVECRLAAGMPLECPQESRMSAACRGSLPQRHAADHRWCNPRSSYLGIDSSVRPVG